MFHQDILQFFGDLQVRFHRTFIIIERKADAKGQLISERLFGFYNSPKKRTKNVCPSRLGQKLTFFGRIEDTKISFRD